MTQATNQDRYKKHLNKLKQSGKTRFTLTINVQDARAISSMTLKDRRRFTEWALPKALEQFAVKEVG